MKFLIVGHPAEKPDETHDCSHIPWEELPEFIRPPSADLVVALSYTPDGDARYAAYGWVPVGKMGWHVALCCPKFPDWLRNVEEEMNFTHAARSALQWGLHPIAAARILLLASGHHDIDPVARGRVLSGSHDGAAVNGLPGDYDTDTDAAALRAVVGDTSWRAF